MAEGVINKVHGLQIQTITTVLSVENRSVNGNSGFLLWYKIPDQNGYKYLATINFCGSGISGLYPVVDSAGRIVSQEGWLYIYNFNPSSVNINNNYYLNAVSLFVKQD